MLSFHTQLRALRYVGSKLRLMGKLRPILLGLHRHTLVDVFGGSGAVIMGAGFTKRVFNDLDGDVVNFFRVLAHPELSTLLFRRLRRLPMSRELFEGIHAHYMAGDKSLSALDSADAAAAFFYKSAFAFGGKVRNGGFAATVSDRNGCKEIKRYRNILRRFSELRHFWQGTVIENLDFAELITTYGNRPGVLLYCDPPYFGTEGYYSHRFTADDHRRLAASLNATKGAVALSYYDVPELDALYPPDTWQRHYIDAAKNNMHGGELKRRVRELVLIKPPHRHRSTLQIHHRSRSSNSLNTEH